MCKSRAIINYLDNYNCSTRSKAQDGKMRRMADRIHARAIERCGAVAEGSDRCCFNLSPIGGGPSTPTRFDGIGRMRRKQYRNK
jgi:hypothetical protein